ncbi:MAG: DsrE family protein [Desulfovermiculus sp.]
MNKDNTELLILWATPDKDTAENMVFMYGQNAKLNNWWEKVTLLIWGGATRLVATDSLIQDKLTKVQEAGVQVIACKRCAEKLNLVQPLEDLGINVFYTGQFLTEWLKDDKKLLTI